MNESNKTALEPFGQALLGYWRGHESAVLFHEFKSGQTKSLPVSVFFRSHGEFLPTENALGFCRGRVLVVGAGTGVHALELEKLGHDVTAIDICSQAVDIMKERGIEDARHQDFFSMEFDGEGFDTILMLGHNLGICGTLKGIRGLLGRCEKLLCPGGRLLVNSIKEPGSLHASDHKGYPGELEFRLSYDGTTGPWMRWLHVDLDTLTSHAVECGWVVERLIETEEGGFLARLKPNP